MSRRSIEHKYHEGNVKRTLKRELKVFETVSNQAISLVGCLLSLSFWLAVGGIHLVWVSLGCQLKWEGERYGKLVKFIETTQQRGSE
jgi:hypothetical protein